MVGRFDTGLSPAGRLQGSNSLKSSLYLVWYSPARGKAEGTAQSVGGEERAAARAASGRLHLGESREQLHRLHHHPQTSHTHTSITHKEIPQSASRSAQRATDRGQSQPKRTPVIMANLAVASNRQLWVVSPGANPRPRPLVAARQVGAPPSLHCSGPPHAPPALASVVARALEVGIGERGIGRPPRNAREGMHL